MIDLAEVSWFILEEEYMTQIIAAGSVKDQYITKMMSDHFF